MTYSFLLEWILDLEFFLAYRMVACGIPVEVEAFDMESNLVGSNPLGDIVIEDPVIDLNSNMAFKAFNL